MDALLENTTMARVGNRRRKVPIANRGAIAIRPSRAARELGVESVAMFSHEDRSTLHWQSEDGAHEVREPGHLDWLNLGIDGLGIQRQRLIAAG